MSNIKGLKNLTKNTIYSNSSQNIKNIPEGKEILDILLKDIVEDKKQVRQHFDQETLEELSGSIKEYGVLSPILVIKITKGKDKGKYKILTGERRYRACKKAKQNSIPCIVYDKAKDDDEIKAIQLIENIQRQNLTAIETAKAIAQLKEKYNDEKNVELAKKLGVSASVVNKNLTIMELDSEMLSGIEKAKKDVSFNALYKVASAKKATQKKEFNKLMASLEEEKKKIDVDEEAVAQEEKEEKKKKKKLSKPTIEKAWQQLQDEIKEDVTLLKRYITKTKLEGLANAYKVKEKEEKEEKKETSKSKKVAKPKRSKKK